MPEEATINIKFSPELLHDLEDWSEPVSLKAECDATDAWTLIIKRVSLAEAIFDRIMRA